MDARVSFDIAAYHLDWKDIQLLTVVNNFGVNINGGTAVATASKVSCTFGRDRGCSSVNGAWIDAQLTDDTPPLAGGFDGDRLPFTPKVSFSLNADYEWKLVGTTTAFVGGTLAYTGSQRDNFNVSDIVGVDPVTDDFIFAFTPQRRIADYAIIDLRAGVDFGRFTLEAYVKNLYDAEGVNSIDGSRIDDPGTNILPDDAIRAAFIRPRTIGLHLSAGF